MTLKEQFEMRQRQWDELHHWEADNPSSSAPPQMSSPTSVQFSVGCRPVNVSAILSLRKSVS
jgi:hypothetical protein